MRAPWILMTAAVGCGMVGTGGSSSRAQAAPRKGPIVTGALTAISSSYDQTCGIRASGRLVCWGLNIDLSGDPPLGRFSAVASGPYGVCGIRVGGSLSCWGVEKLVPRGRFLSVGAGECGIEAGGWVVCWASVGNELETHTESGRFVQIGGGEVDSDCGVRLGER